MQQINQNALNNAKRAIDNMFTESQKNEIINAVKNVDKQKLQSMMNQLNKNNINENNIQNIIKNVSKDEIIRFLKGV